MTYVKIGAALILLGIMFYLGTLWSDAKLERMVANQATALNALQAAALTKDRQYEIRIEAAEAKRNTVVDGLDAITITKPIWLSDTGALCTASVIAAPGGASVIAPGGDVKPGVGRDISPDLTAFKKRWETVIANCHLLQDSQ